MVLCEKLLSGNFCILVAEASARSQSDAHPELCTVAADGMLPGQQLKARHGTCSLCPGSLVQRFHQWSRLCPALRHHHAPLCKPGSLPRMKTRLIVQWLSLHLGFEEPGLTPCLSTHWYVAFFLSAWVCSSGNLKKYPPKVVLWRFSYVLDGTTWHAVGTQ